MKIRGRWDFKDFLTTNKKVSPSLGYFYFSVCKVSDEEKEMGNIEDRLRLSDSRPSIMSECDVYSAQA